MPTLPSFRSNARRKSCTTFALWALCGVCLLLLAGNPFPQAANAEPWETAYVLQKGAGVQALGVRLYSLKDVQKDFAPVRLVSTIPGVDVTVRYPSNLGNPLFTSLAEATAKAIWHDFAEEMYSLLEYTPPPGMKRYAQTQYSVTQSSPRYFSLIFETYADILSARNIWAFSVLSFDRTTGKQLTLQDIFPDSSRYASETLPVLMPEIVRQFQDQRNEQGACVLEPDASISMDKIALYQDGLYIFYSSGYERGCGYAPVLLTLPKDMLVTLGVPAKLWE